MPRTYEQSVAELYQAAPEQFVAERKRLAAELKTGGDKESAKRLEKLPRPSLSAWAVNQLWWQARADFEELFQSAARLRAGDLAAMRAHRAALEALRGRAADILRAGSHAVTDAVTRRVSNTLAALAANGNFDPDVPGALAADRDAPGFGAQGLAGMLAAAVPTVHESMPQPKRAELDEDRERAERERRRIEQQRAAARAERQKLEAELQRARADADAHAGALERLRNALATEEQALERVRATVAELEARLAVLGDA